MAQGLNKAWVEIKESSARQEPRLLLPIHSDLYNNSQFAPNLPCSSIDCPNSYPVKFFIGTQSLVFNGTAT